MSSSPHGSILLFANLGHHMVDAVVEALFWLNVILIDQPLKSHRSDETVSKASLGFFLVGLRYPPI